jgi:hypothetical protein
VDQFYVELDLLDDLGNNRLPAISQSLSNAHNQLWAATDWITRAFDTRGDSYNREAPWDPHAPDELNGVSLYYKAGNECFYAMDFMRQILEDNVENVNLAAQAVREIALRYRQVDGQA